MTKAPPFMNWKVDHGRESQRGRKAVFARVQSLHTPTSVEIGSARSARGPAVVPMHAAIQRVPFHGIRPAAGDEVVQLLDGQSLGRLRAGVVVINS